MTLTEDRPGESSVPVSGYNVPADPHGRDRVGERAGAAELEHVVDAPTAGSVGYGAAPILHLAPQTSPPSQARAYSARSMNIMISRPSLALPKR
jgi:hypothetical protein